MFSTHFSHTSVFFALFTVLLTTDGLNPYPQLHPPPLFVVIFKSILVYLNCTHRPPSLLLFICVHPHHHPTTSVYHHPQPPDHPTTIHPHLWRTPSICQCVYKSSQVKYVYVSVYVWRCTTVLSTSVHQRVAVFSPPNTHPPVLPWLAQPHPLHARSDCLLPTAYRLPTTPFPSPFSLPFHRLKRWSWRWTDYIPFSS